MRLPAIVSDRRRILIRRTLLPPRGRCSSNPQAAERCQERLCLQCSPPRDDRACPVHSRHSRLALGAGAGERGAPPSGGGARLGGRADRASSHPHERRQDPGPAARRGRRQGPVHQGNRHRAALRRNRHRGPFGQGPAVAAAAGHRDRRQAAREDARDALVSAFAARSRACRTGRPSAPRRSGARPRRCG